METDPRKAPTATREQTAPVTMKAMRAAPCSSSVWSSGTLSAARSSFCKVLARTDESVPNQASRCTSYEHTVSRQPSTTCSKRTRQQLQQGQNEDAHANGQTAAECTRHRGPGGRKNEGTARPLRFFIRTAATTDGCAGGVGLHWPPLRPDRVTVPRQLGNERSCGRMLSVRCPVRPPPKSCES